MEQREMDWHAQAGVFEELVMQRADPQSDVYKAFQAVRDDAERSQTFPRTELVNAAMAELGKMPEPERRFVLNGWAFDPVYSSREEMADFHFVRGGLCISSRDDGRIGSEFTSIFDRDHVNGVQVLIREGTTRQAALAALDRARLMVD